MLHTRQSGPNSGLGFQVKVFETLVFRFCLAAESPPLKPVPQTQGRTLKTVMQESRTVRGRRDSGLDMHDIRY